MSTEHPSTPSEQSAAHGRPRDFAGPLLVATAGRGAAEVLAAARFLVARLGVRPLVAAVHEPTLSYLPEVGLSPLLPELEEEQRTLL